METLAPVKRRKSIMEVHEGKTYNIQDLVGSPKNKPAIPHSNFLKCIGIDHKRNAVFLPNAARDKDFRQNIYHQ